MKLSLAVNELFIPLLLDDKQNASLNCQCHALHKYWINRNIDGVLKLCLQRTTHCATTYGRDERHASSSLLAAFSRSTIIIFWMPLSVCFYIMIHCNVLMINISSHFMVLKQISRKKMFRGWWWWWWWLVYFDLLLLYT